MATEATRQGCCTCGVQRVPTVPDSSDERLLCKKESVSVASFRLLVTLLRTRRTRRGQYERDDRLKVRNRGPLYPFLQSAVKYRPDDSARQESPEFLRKRERLPRRRKKKKHRRRLEELSKRTFTGLSLPPTSRVSSAADLALTASSTNRTNLAADTRREPRWGEKRQRQRTRAQGIVRYQK